MNTSKYDSPVCLTSPVVALVALAAKPLDFAKMANRSRGWLRITEFRFFLQKVDDNTSNTIDSLGGIISISASVGRNQITNGQVPIWLLGPRLSYYGETGARGYLQRTAVGPFAETPLSPVNCYTWTLPKPMLVPPGTSLGMLVARLGTNPTMDDGSSTVNVTVSAVGTRLASTPKVRETDVPYVTHFRTGPLAASILESGQGPLANPFTKPFMVERFVQRTGFELEDYNVCEGNVGAALAAGSTLPMNIRLRLFTDHYEVVSETKPTPQVFSAGHGAPAAIGMDDPQGKVVVDTVINPQFATWRVGTVLRPKGWYNAEFSCNGANDLATRGAFATAPMTLGFGADPMISMIGSRREKI